MKVLPALTVGLVLFSALQGAGLAEEGEVVVADGTFERPFTTLEAGQAAAAEREKRLFVYVIDSI